MHLSAFKQTAWLQNIWTPVADDAVIVVASAAEFYNEIYKPPYEAWCVEDHNEASKLDAAFQSEIQELASQAYLVAWAALPEPEFCALFSDDIDTIASLLILRTELKSFTEQRMTWYVAGRFPCGYAGEFPNGKWMIV